jgi:cysteine desulfuration protein SufE
MTERLQLIIEEFKALPEEKYELLVEYGKKLPPYPEEFKTNEHLVPGCISVVYIASEIRDGRVHFKGYADSLLVKGLVAILVLGLEDMHVKDFLDMDASFLLQFGLNDSLTPSRANASLNIFKLMQRQIAAQMQ